MKKDMPLKTSIPNDKELSKQFKLNFHKVLKLKNFTCSNIFCKLERLSNYKLLAVGDDQMTNVP